MALINGLGYGDISAPLSGLTFEERLVSARLLFIRIRELGVDRQYGLHGHCINVAVDLKDTVCVLPRLPSESDTIVVEIKRRMNDPRAYIRENEQGGPDTPIDLVLGNPGSGSHVGCLPSLRLSCSLVHKPETSETRFKALQPVHLS